MKIICLGDSLTYGFGVRPSQRWVTLLNSESQDQWINAGVNGDTTGGMLARLNPLLEQKPRVVFILGGSNDILIGGSAGPAKANLMAMAQQCIYHNAVPVIGFPLLPRDTRNCPWRELFDEDSLYQEGLLYLNWLSVFCRTFRFASLDFNTVLDRQDDSLFLPDGLHPSANGHRLMADAVLALRKRSF